MPIYAEDMEQIKTTETMRGLLVGGYKSGKSWTLATAPDPVVIVDSDQRADSLKGKKGVFTLTPYDTPGSFMQPTIYSQIVDIIGNLEKSPLLGDINPKFANSPRAKEEIKSFCIDSLQSTDNAIMKYNLYTNPGIAKEIKIAGQRILFPGGWDAWNADMASVEELVGRLISVAVTRGIGLWVTFHEEIDENGKVGLFPNRHKNVVRLFNEVWRITRKTNIPEAQLSPTFDFTACTTLIGAPGVVPNPNIKELTRLYGNKP